MNRVKDTRIRLKTSPRNVGSWNFVGQGALAIVEWGEFVCPKPSDHFVTTIGRRAEARNSEHARLTGPRKSLF